MSESRDAVLKQRFFHEGETTEDQVWERTARAWAVDSTQAAQFKAMMKDKRAFPNTPAIANAGRKIQMGSACFVLPIEDSLHGESSIMQTLADAAQVHKSGGGTGFNFSRIRAQGEEVSSTGRAAPGPVHFLTKLYSPAISAVTQAGMRPGANMGILNVDHPDIEEFIQCKVAEGNVHNFNISVGLTDSFMRGIVHGTASVREEEIWTQIVDGAWRNGEPGAYFTDAVNAERLHPELIEATNPCGEVPLLPYEACVLGSINLAAHIEDKQMNYRLLEITTRTLTRMLDNIVEKQDYPLPIIRETHHKYRKIGIGVMGYHDALILCEQLYGSPAALHLAGDWMEFIQKIAYDESNKMAQANGPYPGWEDAEKHGKNLGPHGGFRRNLCVGVIAPTGTISRLAECSFGIEPIFAGEYESFILGGMYTDTHPLKDHPFFMTAKDVTPRQHVLTQAAFQQHCDQAVSKTVNLPHDATHEDVAEIYRLAWETGCKGITVLREASREDVVIKECEGGTCAL